MPLNQNGDNRQCLIGCQYRLIEIFCFVCFLIMPNVRPQINYNNYIAPITFENITDMLDIRWYLLVVAVPMLLASIWATVNNTPDQSHRERLNYLRGTFIKCAISSIAYWILVFILTLVIAAGIWLALLLLIWVPSDFFQNYFGADVFSKALANIKPAIYKTAGSPGITAIPLLDYLSLTAAYILGPWLGIWSILSQTKTTHAGPDAQPQN